LAVEVLGALTHIELLGVLPATGHIGTKLRVKSLVNEKLLTFLYAKYDDYAAVGIDWL